MYADGTCPSTTAADGTVTRGACPDAYGKVLGESPACIAPALRVLIVRRHLDDLRVPGNIHVLRPRTGTEADIPSYGHR